MPALSPVRLASGHSSAWVRFVIRALSIRGATWWILALSLLATVLACRQAWQGERKGQEIRFESEAETLKDALSERLNRYLQMLQGVRGLFAASESVEEGEFRAYVSSLDYQRDYPGIVGMGYLDRGGQDQDLDDMLLRYLEPAATDRKSLPLGWDRDPAQRAAAYKSCDSAAPILSPKTNFGEDPDTSVVILYQAVFKNAADPKIHGERQSLLQGWVCIIFRSEVLMRAVCQATYSPLDYEVFDGDPSRPENFLCRSLQTDGPSSTDRFRQQEAVPVFGRPWTIRVMAPLDAVGAVNPFPIELLAGGGLTISLLLFGIAQSMATTGQRACSLAMEMTEKLQAQKEALRQSEERLEMVIEGSNDGIWDWNVESDDVYFSPRWKSMLGYEDHEIENKFSSWEDLLHPDDRERALKLLKRYFASETPIYQIECRLRHKDGGYRWVLSRGVASRGADGQPVRMAGSHLDLTDLKNVERELLAANSELHDSQTHLQSTLAELSASHAQLEKTQLELIQAAKLESVGTLAAGVAHEVKNPLQIILMGLDYLDLRFADVEEDTRVTLHDMRDAALRADLITKDLLKFSSATEFEPSAADLEQVLERSLRLMRTDLNRAGVTLVKNLSEELPPVSIDTPKIQQVLINLINNALQAMKHKGTLTITTAMDRLDRVLPPRRQYHCPIDPLEEVVVLKVHDDGPGIPEDLLSRIFDPFFTTKTVGSGTGLGLSVVKKIIDLHGACIHIQNHPRGGAEVILAFATAPKPATPPPERCSGYENALHTITK